MVALTRSVAVTKGSRTTLGQPILAEHLAQHGEGFHHTCLAYPTIEAMRDAKSELLENGWFEEDILPRLRERVKDLNRETLES